MPEARVFGIFGVGGHVVGGGVYILLLCRYRGFDEVRGSVCEGVQKECLHITNAVLTVEAVTIHSTKSERKKPRLAVF